jgi:hypothetical protein
MVLLPRGGGNRLDGVEYGAVARITEQLTKASCAMEEEHSFFKPAMTMLKGRDSSGYC